MFTSKNKNAITTTVIILLLLSLLVSRAALSIATVLFAILPLLLEPNFFLKNLQKNKFLLLIAAPLIVTVVGLFNTENTQEWLSLFWMKLPLLLIAIGFIGFKLSNINQFIVNQLFVFFIVAGTFYTCSYYYLNPQFYENQYHYAKVLPTVMDKDHIRFSWCVCVAILLVIHNHYEIIKKSHKIINAIIGVWLFIFLHILGSKTGLLFAYGIVAGYFIYFFWVAQKWKWSLVFIAGIVVVPFVAYKMMPTFKNRIDYLVYDFSNYSKGNFSEGLSDGARVLSIKGGYELWKENKLLGVGYGDVQNQMNDWYEQKKPGIQDYEKILPSSQFLMTLAGSGIIGLLILVVSLAAIVFKIFSKRNILFSLFFMTAVMGFFFEIPLESQYGVFIFSFFSLWFLHLPNNFKTTQ